MVPSPGTPSQGTLLPALCPSQVGSLSRGGGPWPALDMGATEIPGKGSAEASSGAHDSFVSQHFGPQLLKCERRSPRQPCPGQVPAGVQGRRGAGFRSQLCLCSRGQHEEGSWGVRWALPLWDLAASTRSSGGTVSGCSVGPWQAGGVPPLLPSPSSSALGAHWVPAPAAPGQPATEAAKNTLPAAGQPRAREAVGSGAGVRGYSQRAAGLFLASQY